MEVSAGEVGAREIGTVEPGSSEVGVPILRAGLKIGLIASETLILNRDVFEDSVILSAMNVLFSLK